MPFFETLASTLKSLPTEGIGNLYPPIGSGGLFSKLGETLNSIKPSATPSNTKLDLSSTDFTPQSDTAFSTPATLPSEKGTFGILKSFSQGLVEMYTKPAPIVTQVEKAVIPPGTGGIGAFLMKGFLRTFTPFVAPLGKDIGERILLRDIMPKIQSGEIPANVVNEFETLNKTAPQIVGDVGMAVLSAYSPSLFGKQAILIKNAPIRTAIAQGALHGSTAGFGFGVASGLSSGTTDPMEFAKHVTEGVFTMGVLGAITSGIIPVGKELKNKVIEVQNKIELDLIAKGYTPAEAKMYAQRGGFIGEMPPKSTDSLAQEAPKSLQPLEEFVKAQREGAKPLSSSKTYSYTKMSPDRIGNTTETVKYSDLPEKVTVYKGGGNLFDGSFVSLDKTYAGTYGEVKEFKVNKGDLMVANNGDLFYKQPSKSQLTDIWNQANKEKVSTESSSIPTREDVAGMVEAMQAALDENPAGRLWKYANKSTGELPEMTGGGKSIFGKTGDQKLSELYGYDVTEQQVLKDFESWKKMRTDIRILQDQLKTTDKLSAAGEREVARITREQASIFERAQNSAIKNLGKQERSPELVQSEKQLLNARLRNEARGAKKGFSAGIVQGKEQILSKLPAPVSQLTESKLLLERMKTLSRGAREGAFGSRQDIGSAQTELVDIIKTSKLDLNDKGKFLSTVKNIQGKEDLTTALPEIQNRIENLVNLSQARGLKSDIKELLADTKTRLQSGKPVGKYTPEIQKLLDQVRQSSKLTVAKARAKIQANIEKYPEGDMPSQIALENEILNMTIGTYRDNPVELQTTKDTLSALVEQGQTINFLKKFNHQAEIDGYRTLVKEKVLQGKDILPEDARAKLSFKKKAIQFFKGFGKNLVLDWNGLMETMDGGSKIDTGAMVNTFSVHEQNNQFKRLGDITREETMNAIKKAYGLENDGQALKKIADIGKEEIHLGEFVNSEGRKQNFTFTRGELMKRYIEMKDPSLAETITLGNKQTKEINNAIENALTIKDKELADAVLEIYKNQHHIINPVYRELFGVDLPFNEFYSNIQRRGYKVEDLNYELERPVGNGVIPQNFTKSRVANTLPLGKQDIFSALFSHLSDTNYWASWATKMQALRETFLDPTVKEAITQEYGRGFYRQIVEKINKFSVNGRVQATGFDKILNFMRKNYTRGVLMIKPKQALNQMTSVFAYLEKMSPIEFSAGIADFWLHPIENTKTLAKESIFIRDRASNSERDISYAMNSNEYKQMKSTKFNSVTNIGMANVTMGDKLSVVPGSWALRRKLLKEGMPIEKVVSEYEKFSNATQQSSDISNLSGPELGGAASKLFTMFKSFSRQSLQREILGIRKLFEKDGFTKENVGKAARIIAIYHVLLPVLSTFAANFGRTDEQAIKEYERAALLGPMNGLFLAGDIVDGIIRAALGLKVWNVDTPIAQVGNDLLKTVQSLDINDISLQDIKNATDLLSETTGLPFSQAQTTVSGFQKILDDNTDNNIEGIANIGGWSDYSASGPKVFQNYGKGNGNLKMPSLKMPSLKMTMPSLKF